MLLRHYLDQGLSKAGLARKLGISRRTVYHWIEQGQLDRELDEGSVKYGPRARIERKIDPYRDLIRERLEAYPKLTATRLFEEIRASGYPGGYTQVKAYVREIRPKPEVEPIVRFETPAGHQGQVDFAEFRLPWGKRYALVVVLGYSRLLWLQFYERQTMEVLIRGLEASFEFFGGVTAELLFDQMKSVVIDDQRLKGGAVFENEEFLRFAAHWGFRVRACRPYRAQTKGKVERPIRYVRESFFYAREFLNDADLNAQALSWLARVANKRLHATTGQRPLERFERDERAALKGLALRPYRSLVGPAPYAHSAKKVTVATGLPTVERRSLEVYGQLSEMGS